MAMACLNFEDKLDGASNFFSWKARMTLLFKEHDLSEIMEKVVPTLTDAAKKAALEEGHQIPKSHHECREGPVNPSLGGKQSARKTFKALVDLFQSDNLNRKMVLRNKLRSIQMSRSDNVTSYFMRITQTRD
jgi:hypothetical protein